MKYVFWNVGSFLGPFFLALETVYLGSQGKAGGDIDGLTIAQVMNLHLRAPQSNDFVGSLIRPCQRSYEM